MIRLKRLTSLSAALLLAGGMSLAHAAAIPSGTKLKIDQGATDATGTGCVSGSCFSMEMAPGFYAWTGFAPGTDGGLILGKNQATGGQETGPSSAITTSGELTSAWLFFGNYGTFATAPFAGTGEGVATTDASINVFSDAACSTVAGCVGKTELNTWHTAWNGVAISMGSSTPCTLPSCSADQLTYGKGVSAWTLTPAGATGIADDLYVLNYDWVVPNGSFTGVRFGLHLTGAVVLAGSNATKIPDGTHLSIDQGATDATGTGCVSGSCFSMEMAPGFYAWTGFAPGTDGGLILGKNQATGGQETGPSSAITTSGELTKAWLFFGNYGTFATAPFNGAGEGAATTDASINSFSKASCSTVAGCVGKTELNTWHTAWNGVAISMGSSTPCVLPSCSADQLTYGKGVSAWTLTPAGATGIADDLYVLNYDWVVPNGGFTGVRFGLHLTGKIGPEIVIDPIPFANPVSITTNQDVPAVWIPVVGITGNFTLNCAIVTQPLHGVVTVSIDCSSGTYVPNAGYSGADAFTYKAIGGFGESTPATVSVTVTPKLACNYPLASFTTVGGGQSTPVNASMKATFTGHLITTSSRGVSVCSGTTVDYVVTSTVGSPICMVNGAVTSNSGVIKPGSKLLCTNKPTGADTDRYSIK